MAWIRMRVGQSWKEIIVQNILHIHSAANTTPCYTGTPWSENIHLLGTSSQGTTSNECADCINQLGQHGRYYTQYVSTYGTSRGGQTGWDTYWQCPNGHKIQGSRVGTFSGTVRGTDWSLTCTHGSENVGVFKLNKRGSSLSITSEAPHLTITGYAWKYGGTTISTTDTCKITEKGVYSCDIKYTDLYSNTSQTKTISYTAT